MEFGEGKADVEGNVPTYIILASLGTNGEKLVGIRTI